MQTSSHHKPIALVGMACRLPGADDLDSYWRLIRGGVSTARPLPDSRLDRSLYYDPRKSVQNRTYSDIGCLVNDEARGKHFDALPAAVRDCPEAAYRTLCDVAADALADARMEICPSRRRSGGVYLGHSRSGGLAGDLAYGTTVAQSARLLHQVDSFRQLQIDHQQVIDDLVAEVRREYPHRDQQGGPTLGPYAAAEMLAHTFAMHGPFMTFNSACASSLNALYQASLALGQGRIETALVGGASVCHFETLVMFSQAQSLSAVKSRPFDHDADGLIVGEGFVVVVLKRLEDAIRDGNKIHAVIRGIGVSSDGKGKSLWAPRVEGQVTAIRRAYGANLTTQNLQYIEAHATSTQLGDATEVTALQAAIDLPPDSRIPIGSVKANIGHTLETAGLAGLLKVVLSMRHKTIAPAANLTRLNKKIDWQSLPFYVPLKPEHWPSPSNGEPRRGAVNAFGIGGLNVHVVLDEFSTAAPRITRRIGPQNEGDSDRSANPPIAIVGRGTILPGAQNVDAFAKLLTSGIDPKSAVDQQRLNSEVYLDSSQPKHWHCTNNLAGQVTDFQYDWRKHKIPPKQIANASPLQFMILDAVDQAFVEAGIDRESMDRRRVGVIVGSSFGGEFTTQLLMGLRLPEFQKRLTQHFGRLGCDADQCVTISKQYADALVKELPALLDETGSFTSSSLASRITKSFDLMGGGVAVDAGSCSSSAALMCCMDQLASGAVDTMICVGAQQDLSPTFFERMGLVGLLAKGSPLSPFDEAARGTVPGEGCAAVVLMRLADAEQQGHKVLGVIRGIGAATADHQSEASEAAVRGAFQAAAVTRGNDAPVVTDDVARIESTSLGTAQLAAAELEGIFHGYAEPSRNRAISLDCLMPQTGHLGAASAMAALVKSSLELQNRKTTASFGLTNKSPMIESNPLFDVAQQANPLTPSNANGRLVSAIHNAERQTAYHILLERDAKVHAPNHQHKSSITNATYDSQIIEGISVIDATRRRKNAMREKASQRRDDGISCEELQPPPAMTAQPHSTQAIAPGPKTAPSVPPAAPVAKKAGLSIPELKEFLTNFVVEQTGYPAEFVEMDGDLEADLGIDSIKKAQMFGELGEHFSVTPDENLTLDDFPTLQHIFDYLADAEKVAPIEANSGLEEPASGVTLNPQPTAANATAMQAPSAPSQPAPAPPASVQPAPTPPARNTRSTANQTKFIEFVAEQTGYPIALLQLEADLELDLGIDDDQRKQLYEGLCDAFEINTEQPRNPDQCKTLQDLFDSIKSPPKVAKTDRTEALIPDFKRLSRTMELLSLAGLSVPYFAEHESVTQDTTRVGGKQMITFCSSNYLGMSGDPVVSAAAKAATDRYGTSVSASRLIAGKPLHRELEDQLARFLGADAALVFSSGYAANESTIGHLFGPGDLIIHDSLAHNCIIQGAILSGAQRLSFPHNDAEALDRQLQQIRHNYRRTLIAIEGAYSMDGDHPDLPRFLEIKQKHDAFLLVDDAHAIGTMGATGRGSPEFHNIDPSDIDLWVGTLSKALGSGGGFVAGSSDLIEYLKFSTPGFIYTVALSPSSAGAALASLRLLQQEPQRVAKLQNNAKLLLQLAKARGLDTGPAGDTPVIPIMVGNSHTALLLSRRLLERGIDIQPIVYPAVENDAARLRFMITARHTEAQIRSTIDALAEDLKIVESQSVPVDQWKAVLNGKVPLSELASNGSAPETIHDPPQQEATIEPEPIQTDPAPEPLTSPTSDSKADSHWSKPELQDYLINFIVEQTGYPPEFVEMDADLEADLGIDSIKKAQLFGELGQHFDIVPDEDLTLDDFPTLQQVFDFIADQMGITA